MTQKSDLFKGQKKKKKTIPPNRHGKAPQTRKGKRVMNPSNLTNDMKANRELSKFINQCNEIKAANMASKEGGQLSIIKVEEDASNASKKLSL